MAKDRRSRVQIPPPAPQSVAQVRGPSGIAQGSSGSYNPWGYGDPGSDLQRQLIAQRLQEQNARLQGMLRPPGGAPGGGPLPPVVDAPGGMAIIPEDPRLRQGPGPGEPRRGGDPGQNRETWLRSTTSGDPYAKLLDPTIGGRRPATGPLPPVSGGGAVSGLGVPPQSPWPSPQTTQRPPQATSALPKMRPETGGTDPRMTDWLKSYGGRAASDWSASGVPEPKKPLTGQPPAMAALTGLRAARTK